MTVHQHFLGGHFSRSNQMLYEGFVVDYIEPTFVNFAVFNFADCCITVGACLMIIFTVYDLIKENKKYLDDGDVKDSGNKDE